MMDRVHNRWLVCSLLGIAMAGCSSANDDSMVDAVGAAGTASGGTAGTTNSAGAGGFGEDDSPTAGTGGTAGLGTAGTTAGAGGGGAMAGSGGSAAVPDAGITPDSGTGQTLPPITDYTEAGPFGTTMTSNVGPGSNYTIFRPEHLGENGFVHSPVIFGPGILTSPASYSALLTHLASHGFVIIVVNSLSGGPGNAANLEAMRIGLEWLIAQHNEPGVFESKLAVDRAVTMGYSLGATASVQLSSHEAILTTVMIHGHSTSGDPNGPVLLLTGTQDVINDVRSTLSTLDGAPAIMTALPIGHLAVLSELSASGRYIGPITAWLRYWVNGDQEAKRFFWGAGCEMCSSPWITPETNTAWEAQMLGD